MCIRDSIQQSPARCIELLNQVGICFFFAQKYHSSMKYVGAIRRELGFRTVFNILGPLTNPGTPSMQLLGVYDGYLVEPLAQVLSNLGVRRGMVVYGQDRLDEISDVYKRQICAICSPEHFTGPAGISPSWPMCWATAASKPRGFIARCV